MQYFAKIPSSIRVGGSKPSPTGLKTVLVHSVARVLQPSNFGKGVVPDLAYRRFKRVLYPV